MHAMGLATEDIVQFVGRCDTYRQLSAQFFKPGSEQDDKPQPAPK